MENLKVDVRKSSGQDFGMVYENASGDATETTRQMSGSGARLAKKEGKELDKSRF